MNDLIKKTLIFFLILIPTALIAQENITNLSWVDFPSEKIEFYINSTRDVNYEINKLVEEYHTIKKDEFLEIDARIVKLKQINELLTRMATDPVLHNKAGILQRLANVAISKVKYLQELQGIYKNKQYTPESLHKYHLATKNKSISKKYQQLFLVNKLMYDAKLPTFWGYYWLESIDPCHRQLTDYYMKWQASNSAKPFFMWLETQSIPYYIPAIHYFNDEELAKNIINIKNGQLLNAQNEPLNATEPEIAYLFAIMPDKTFYVAKGSSSVRHTSITKGKPVLASGEIKVNNGIVTYWNTESGHYQPNISHALQTAALFNDLGINLSDDCQAMYYSNDGKEIKPCLQMLLATKEQIANTGHSDTGSRAILEELL